MDLQLWIVLAAVIPAGWYVARTFRRQFDRSEDEAAGCSACPANEMAALAAAKRRKTAAADPPPEEEKP